MANGDLIKLGTLYVGGAKKARPSYPWRDGTGPTGLGAPAAGDIFQYTGSGNIEIRNTDSSEAYKLYWREVTDGGKTLLIADRNILCAASWEHLNNQSLVFGKEVTIDGQLYKLRLLTGGTDLRTSGDNYGKAIPTNNEWDRYINNEGGFSGLPTPSGVDLTSGPTAEQRTRTHNQFWNWWYEYTWCQETYAQNTASRALRGYYAASYYIWTPASNVNAFYGFRPVLEVLNSAPLISDNDRDLGSRSAPVVLSYTVAEGDGDKFSIFEYINGTQIRTLSNQVSGTSYTIDLTSRWGSLANNTRHTIKITATDVYGASSTRTITFTKSNSAPGTPTITSHISGRRVGAAFYVEFRPGTDAENDPQTMKLQVANNSAFSSGLQTFTTMQKKNDSSWVTATSVTNSDSSATFRIQASGMALNTSKYIRIGATDESGSGGTTWSATVQVAVGDVLEVQSKPFPTDYQPTSIAVKDNKVIDNKAGVQVFVCNNGLDSSPTWEDASADYAAGQSHTFTNTQKTAASWAVSIRYVVTANDATGEISISAIGAGVN